MTTKLAHHVDVDSPAIDDGWETSRLLLISLLVFAAFLTTLVVQLWQGWDRLERGGLPVFTDYTPVYAASLLLQREPAENLYVTERMIQAEIDAAQAAYDHRLTDQQARSHGFARWQYPPVFMLYAHPLAWMPYYVSMAAWLLITALPYLAAMLRAAPARLAWPLALAAPPVYFNLIYGQTGFLTAGYLALGLTLLRRHPWLAGFFIGMACFKPHFGLLVPLALIAAGQWRAIVSATFTVFVLVVVTVLVYGDDPWLAFIGTLGYSLDGFALGRYNFDPMTSVIGAVRLAGGNAVVGWWLQGLSVVVAVVLTWWSWRQHTNAGYDLLPLQAAILCTATLLTAPLSYLYDLVLLVPVAGWLLIDMHRRGNESWEVVLLLMLLGGTMFHLRLAESMGLSYGLVAVCGLLALATRRLLSARSVPVTTA